MISLRLKSTLAIALICFVLGCCTAFLLMGGCSGNVDNEELIPAATLKTQADSLHTHYQAQIQELEKSNSGLMQRLAQTKLELEAVKAKTKSKAGAIKKMIRPKGYPASALLTKSSAPVIENNIEPDRCDSLAMLIDEYIQESGVKDSLYEAQVLQQDSLLCAKEEIITLQSVENKNLTLFLEKSLLQEQSLTNENTRLQKKLKAQRRTSKLLTIGGAILTSLATHYLTR